VGSLGVVSREDDMFWRNAVRKAMAACLYHTPRHCMRELPTASICCHREPLGLSTLLLRYG
jgi:hypothetical protein